MMFRNFEGSHPVCLDVTDRETGEIIELEPRNCINCGAPLDLLREFACPNRLLTPKELGKFRRGQYRKPDKEKIEELDELWKELKP